MAVAVERGAVLFGPFSVDPKSQRLLREGVRIKLPRQSFLFLQMLLARPGEVVTREELCSALWPSDTFVDFDHGLNNAVNRLRSALSDNGESPVYIETLPRLGYRFIAEVRNGTQPVGASAFYVPESQLQARSSFVSEVVPEVAQASRRTSVRRKVRIAAVCVVLIGLSLYFVFALMPRKLLRLYQLQQLTVTPLTALPGSVASPTFSPDGNQVAFAWTGEDDEAGYDLYIKTLGSDKPLRITRHPAQWLWAAWSPDGRYIAMSRVAGSDDSGIYLVPPTGGPERKLASKATFNRNTSGIAWAPNGKLLAFTDQPPHASWEGDQQLFILSLETLDRIQVETGCPLVLAPAFSPNGDLLAWACVDSWSRYSIHAMRLSDGHIATLLDRADGIGGLSWSLDSSRIVFTSPLDFGDIWELDLKRPKDPARLPVGHDASEITVARARDRLAYVAGTYNVNIWQLDLHDSNPHPRRLIVSSREQKAPHMSPDHGKIAFESTRAGSNELWICDADGTNARQLTTFGIRSTGSPRWSPSGLTIAFDSRVEGEANLYLIDPNRGVPQKLHIPNVHGNNLPDWSGDGKWIYFVHGEDTHSPSIWKVPSSGGEAVQIVRSPATYPRESPDGRYLYFVRNSRLWRSSPDGSPEEEVRDMPPLKLLGDKWLLYGGGIYYFSDAEGKTALDYLDLSSHSIRHVTVLDKQPPLWMGQMSISSDGRWLLYPQIDVRSTNLLMMENWH